MISSNRIVSLISAPWPFFDRPSIQLASLKAYLMEHLPQIRVNAHHVYLKVAEAVGYPIYQQISQRSWIAECLYAAILYPEQTDEIKRFWKRKTRTLNLLKDCDFDQLTRRIQAASEDFIAHNPWDRHHDLPIPDFSDYFETLYAMAPKDHFSPHLPMEMSRGCWWRKKGPHGNAGGCAFCNLNLQWRGYRQKSPDRVIHEMKTLVRRHRVLSVFFMDNLLPKTGMDKTFDGLHALGKDLQLRAEIRAETSRKSLMSMGRAGMDEVQVGVEALSSKLLKKLNKGTTFPRPQMEKAIS